MAVWHIRTEKQASVAAGRVTCPGSVLKNLPPVGMGVPKHGVGEETGVTVLGE